MDSLVDATGVAAATNVADDDHVQRACQGDVRAFEALVATRIDRCYRLAWSILGNDADAADATQEGFVAAWRELPRLREPKAFDGWLNRIVARKALSVRRSPVRLREITVAADADYEASTDARDSRNLRSNEDELVEAHSIVRAFERRRPDHRLILVLHHVEDRPLAEIARTLRVPVGTVKSRLHTARRALEQALEAEA